MSNVIIAQRVDEPTPGDVPAGQEGLESASPQGVRLGWWLATSTPGRVLLSALVRGLVVGVYVAIAVTGRGSASRNQGCETHSAGGQGAGNRERLTGSERVVGIRQRPEQKWAGQR